MYDVIVIGGGFAGVTAAREVSLRGRSVLVIEARERLGGRTWATRWRASSIEYGGAWVHWHQPHTWSEISRAGLKVAVSDDVASAGWYARATRHDGTIAERDEIARKGWDMFVDGVRDALPVPHDPLRALDRLVEFDRLSIAQRLGQLPLSGDEQEVLAAELESLAHAPLDEAGAVAVLRWHALSGYSLALTQFTGGRVTIVGGTGALLAAIAGAAPFDRRLGSVVARVSQDDDRVAVLTREGEEVFARAVVVAVPLNALGAIEFEPVLSEPKRRAIALGQASRGIKLFIRARGAPVPQSSIRAGHPFGYLATDAIYDDGTQLLIGFGPDAAVCRADDLRWVQRRLEDILPGYEAVAATAHDWLADEFSRGTWAIHRPGWYERHHAVMREPEGRVLIAGSDFADGWAGFIDGAIESGLRAAGQAIAATARDPGAPVRLATVRAAARASLG